MTKTVITSYRMLRKNKLDFILNLVGLSIAMLVFIFITLYVENETSFDQYHKNASHVFRLTTSITSPNGQETNMALANTAFAHILKEKCPEIEDVVCVDIGGDYAITYQQSKFENINIRAATPSIFRLFDYSVIEGNLDDFLKSPNTIILTKSISKIIFKKDDPIGKVISIDKKDYLVNGIIEDLPNNTDLQFTALIRSEVNGTEDLVDWGDYFVYLQTNNNLINSLEDKIDNLTDEAYQELLKQMGGFTLLHHLQPLTSIHFNHELLADTPKGNKFTVYVFSVIAILILIIAGINYTNLSIAQLHRRRKEFSIKKIIGCSRERIILHVLSESVFYTLLAAILSVFLAYLLLPQFNSLLDKKFEFNFIIRLLIPFILIFIAFGIISGSYPAFKTVNTNTDRNTGFNLLGKFLVIFQNVISIAMIIGVLLIGKQISFMKNHNLGLSEEQIIAINLSFEESDFPGVEALHQEFSKLPEIKSLAFGGGGTNLGSSDNWIKSIMIVKDANNNDVQFVANQPTIDENYLNLFGINLILGRNFSASNPNDPDNAVIINETYVKTMGWDDPIGKFIFENEPLRVIGVVKDFHFETLHNPIEPLMFRMEQNQPAFLFARVEPLNVTTIQKQWEEIFHQVPFKYSFIDEHFAQLYQKNEKEMTFFSFMSFIAILISCLGIYGLASHFIVSMTKEIGIRKVNGAKVSEVLTLLNKDFVKWVAIAFVIATPLAWFAMRKWLENFAYKTELSWWIFALSGIVALGIALLTVSWQSWKAATRNPVEALRYE